ncbi:MAG: hypothetical protein FWC79_07390 [Oscillospiraceae bacterium]|nr:hypothetical protein [Oscillospiraceae bacterium]
MKKTFSNRDEIKRTKRIVLVMAIVLQMFILNLIVRSDILGRVAERYSYSHREIWAVIMGFRELMSTALRPGNSIEYIVSFSMMFVAAAGIQTAIWLLLKSDVISLFQYTIWIEDGKVIFLLKYPKEEQIMLDNKLRIQEKTDCYIKLTDGVKSVEIRHHELTLEYLEENVASFSLSPDLHE